MSHNRLYIIDGHSQLFRAYYAIRRLSNSKGLPTNAIYGFVQMLNKLLREEEPEYIVVAFDSPGETFRSNLYTEYKANRAPSPPDMEVQIPWVKRILSAMGIPMIEIQGVEADDIIGTLAKLAEKHNIETIIVSSDKDLFQLISPKIKVLRQHHDEFKLYDSKAVKDEIGVLPEKITDLFGLMGDSTDNIPGVPKIGPKSAAKLLAQFGSLEDLYENLDKVDNPKWRELLRTHKDIAFLSKKLATIKTDVPLSEVLFHNGFNIERFRRRREPAPELYDIYRELEFQSLLKDQAKTVQERKVDYSVVTTRDLLAEVISQLEKSEIFAIDTETTSNDPMKADLVGISISYKPNSACYIPVGHTRDLFSARSIQLNKSEVLLALKPMLESEHLKKTFHNAKYDIKILMREGIRPQGIEFDTMLASYVLNPERKRHNLKDLARDLLEIQMTPLKDLLGRGKKSKTMAQVEILKAGEYSCQDADITLQLTHILREELKRAGLWELFVSLELPLIDVLIDMEMAGIKIDKEHFQRLSKKLDDRLRELTTQIYQTAGVEFNINSPRQVAEVLFERLKLKPLRSGKTGYSTDISVLEELSKEHPLPSLLLEYRMCEKLKTTYVDTLPEIVNPRTGKIHTTFHQSVTATGRLSSSDPNLQNIPVRTPFGKEIRAGFIPSNPDWVLLSADYSQVELRILAHLSQDKELINAFQQDRDIHRLTASKIFACPEDAVTDEMRDQAKTINFGIIYGMGPQRLAKELKISRKQAEDFINEYFRVYTGVKRWVEETISRARETGYVTTLMNRRRHLPDINSPNASLRNAAERIAINTPVQGTAADLIKKAMLNIHRRLKGSGLQAKMVLQIHDELLFDLPKEELEPLKEIVRKEMEQALRLDVPVKVSLKWGNNWAEC